MRRQERTTSGGPDVDSMPLVLREESYFPYIAGPAFIVELLGEEAVREAAQRGTGYGAHVSPLFQNPPTSTAQVLHPEKYRRAFEPVEITLPDLAAALGNGWEALDQDVLGEIDHRILIAQYLDRDTAEQAADGWAGDRFASLGRGDQTAVAVSTRWDTLADVQEWLAAYSEALQARYGASLRVLRDAPDRIAWEAPDGVQILRADATSTSSPSPRQRRRRPAWSRRCRAHRWPRRRPPAAKRALALPIRKPSGSPATAGLPGVPRRRPPAYNGTAPARGRPAAGSTEAWGRAGPTRRGDAGGWATTGATIARRRATRAAGAANHGSTGGTTPRGSAAGLAAPARAGS